MSRAPGARRPPRGGVVRSRLHGCGLAIAILSAAFLGWGYHTGYWILDRTGKPILTDFTPMWVAGRQALAGRAEAAYDPHRFDQAQRQLVGKKPAYYPWPYPPVYFLPAALVAAFPYAWAFILWQAATLALCLWVAARIAGDGAAAILVVASPLTTYNAMLGQNGLLTASLLGAALLAVERRPLIAGGLLAGLAYKPHFAVVVVLVLACSGRWRALAGALAGSAMLVAASALAFGVRVWLAFPAALARRIDSALVGHDLAWGLFQSVYGLARFLGAAATPAGIAHATLALIAAAATILLWRRPVAYPLKAAAAAAATLLATPYLFAYDMAAIVIPAAFLARDLAERGFLRGERAAAGLIYLGLLAIFFTHGRAPLGAPIILFLFALILRRAAGMPRRALRPTA